MSRRRSPLLAAPLLVAACTSVHDDLSRQILQPPDGWLVAPQDLGLAAEPFEVVIHDEASLTGWWIPSDAADGRTVVLLHEEATNASALHPYYTFLHDAGFHVLAFDPRGYGKSRGTPSLRAWVRDVDAVFDWLEARTDVDPDKIALFGTSMGSLAAMSAARTHRSCRAVVFEHLPSLRDMLREAIRDDGSAASAYRLGMLEFGLPEDIEPLDNAPRVDADALFIATEHESARDRRSLLRAFAAYAGPKELWVLPDTGRAPHAMLTHDGDYQRGIVDFLRRALTSAPLATDAGVRKVSDASDGEAWYEIELGLRRQDETGPWAVEACAVLDSDAPRYARAWIDDTGGNVRMKLPSLPTHVTGRRIFGAVADADQGWKRTPTPLSRSGAAVAHLWPRIEELRNEVLGHPGSVQLAADLRAAAAGEPFHARLEAELADVYARLGLALADTAATRDEAVGWLERAVAAVPARPELHFWPGPVATYGLPRMAVVERARRRLGELRPGGR